MTLKGSTTDSVVPLALAAGYLQTSCQCAPSSRQRVISFHSHAVLGGGRDNPILWTAGTETRITELTGLATKARCGAGVSPGLHQRHCEASAVAGGPERHVRVLSPRSCGPSWGAGGNCRDLWQCVLRHGSDRPGGLPEVSPGSLLLKPASPFPVATSCQRNRLLTTTSKMSLYQVYLKVFISFFPKILESQPVLKSPHVACSL